MKMLNKFSRSTHFCSVIMHISISGCIAVWGIILLQWRHHQCELGGDIGVLRRVGLFRRKLPVKFRHKNVISLALLKGLNIKSQFDIYFICGKVFLNKTCSKLNQNIKYSGPLQNVRFTFTKHSCINAGIF